MSSVAGDLRVLALVTDGYGGFGGISQYNCDFFNALDHCSRISKIWILPRNGMVDGVAVPESVEQLPEVQSKLKFTIKAFLMAMTKGNIDIIFCGHINMMPLAVCLKKITGAALWLQVHGIDAWEKPGLLQKWAVEQADQVTSVSRFTRHQMLAWANIAPGRNYVLPNTVSKSFSPGPKPDYLIERYNLAKKNVLLTVSRLDASEQYKGHDDVIESMPSILDVYPNTVYLIAGDGDDRPRLEKLVRDCGVTENVIFAKRVSDDELVAHFRLADVFVMPSTGEGFGIVFLQALQCGLDVVGDGVDGSADALRDGLLGICLQGEKPSISILKLLEKKSAKNHQLEFKVKDLECFNIENFSMHLNGIVNRLDVGENREVSDKLHTIKNG